MKCRKIDREIRDLEADVGRLSAELGRRLGGTAARVEIDPLMVGGHLLLVRGDLGWSHVHAEDVVGLDPTPTACRFYAGVRAACRDAQAAATVTGRSGDRLRLLAQRDALRAYVEALEVPLD